jgi:hypothetical protein
VYLAPKLAKAPTDPQQKFLYRARETHCAPRS